MSELPDGWEWTQLAELVEVVRGVTYKKAESGTEPGAGLVPIVRATNINGRLETEADLVYVPESVVRPAQLIRAGDIVVASSSGSVSVVGKSAVATEDWDGAFGAFCTLLRPLAGLDARYIGHYVASPSVRRRWSGLASGTNINNLKREHLAKTQVPLAPFAEQHRIVAAIEEQLSNLEHGVRDLHRVLARLDDWKTALVVAGVTGRLVDQHPDDEPAESVLEAARSRRTGRRWSASSGQRPWPELPLPATWLWASVAEVAERVTVGHVGPMKHEYVSEGVPFLRSQNVRENRFDAEGLRFITPRFHQRLSKSRIRAGDVVVVRSGSVGVSCVLPDWLGEANCSDLVIVQRPIAVNPHFLAYCLNSIARRSVRSQTVGVALAHFNTQSVAQLPIPVPPLAEQERIVAELERRLSVVDRVRRAAERALANSATLRASVLANAFSGELVPQSQEDEPASALLERIASERAVSSAKTPKRPLRTPA